MRTKLLILMVAAIMALPVAAQNITRVDDNGNTLYFGLRSNKANKYDKVKTPPSYEVIAKSTALAMPFIMSAEGWRSMAFSLKPSESFL